MKQTKVFPLVAFAAFQLCSQGLYAATSADPPQMKGAPDKTEKDLEYRLKWNVATLVGDYEKHGRHNPKWDESAKAALRGFAESRTYFGLPRASLVGTNMESDVKSAVKSGCDDPMILYLSVRFLAPQGRPGWRERGKQYRLAAESLSQSDYAPIRKFYGALRAAEALDPGSATIPEDVHHWRREASRYLTEAVKDKEMPIVEVFDACHDLLHAVDKDTVELEAFYQAFEPIIFKNWPSESSFYYLKGLFHIQDAWKARGIELADKVTTTGWALFEERLVEAEKALTKAWELNPRDARIAREMMTVELGQGKGRSRMEMWFKRATDLDPNYYDAFAAKLNYLTPKWHGSQQEMLGFARECVNSQRWGGHVPLVLKSAHDELVKYLPLDQRPSYWKRPDVWKDVSASYEKFFLLNPKEIGYRGDYALYAYKAEQWGVLNRLLPLPEDLNYEYFGGKEEFDKMVRTAKEHGGSK